MNTGYSGILRPNRLQPQEAALASSKNAATNNKALLPPFNIPIVAPFRSFIVENGATSTSSTVCHSIQPCTWQFGSALSSERQSLSKKIKISLQIPSGPAPSLKKHVSRTVESQNICQTVFGSVCGCVKNVLTKSEILQTISARKEEPQKRDKYVCFLCGVTSGGFHGKHGDPNYSKRNLAVFMEPLGSIENVPNSYDGVLPPGAHLVFRNNTEKKMTATTTDDGLSIDDGFSDDDSTSHYQSSKSADETRLSNPNTKESAGSSDARETTKMLQRDWKIRMFRYVTIALLVATAIAISVAIYAGLRNTERRDFEHSFEFQASQIERVMDGELNSKLRALDSMSVSATSFSRKSSLPNETWPYITMPHFPHLAAAALYIGRGLSLTLAPVVHRENMVEWQDYSVRANGWISTSLEFQIAHPNAFIVEGAAMSEEEIKKNTSEFIFEVIDGLPAKVEDRDFMLPIWQIAPLPTGLPWVNYDINSRESTASGAQAAIETQSCVLGDMLDLSDSLLA
eukprot:scaffold463_cov92-Cylindrotheca_fusiformis.AAC.9